MGFVISDSFYFLIIHFGISNAVSLVSLSTANIFPLFSFLLLLTAASVNARGFEGRTPLHMAVSGVCVQVSSSWCT